MMGQARDRGTFEERKAQAIADGREKKEKKNTLTKNTHYETDYFTAVVNMLLRRGRK